MFAGIMQWELVIQWENGDKDVFEYPTREAAEGAMEGYEIAFGNQVAWMGTRRKVG